MQNLTYLAVFEPSADGSYSIYFPDLPGCISVGGNLEEASRMAAEAASLHVYSMECDNEEIPTPSVNLPKEDTEGNVIMPITIHPDLFRMKKRQRTNQDKYHSPGMAEKDCRGTKGKLFPAFGNCPDGLPTNTIRQTIIPYCRPTLPNLI